MVDWAPPGDFSAWHDVAEVIYAVLLSWELGGDGNVQDGLSHSAHLLHVAFQRSAITCRLLHSIAAGFQKGTFQEQ